MRFIIIIYIYLFSVYVTLPKKNKIINCATTNSHDGGAGGPNKKNMTCYTSNELRVLFSLGKVMDELMHCYPLSNYAMHENNIRVRSVQDSDTGNISALCTPYPVYISLWLWLLITSRVYQ